MSAAIAKPPSFKRIKLKYVLPNVKNTLNFDNCRVDVEFIDGLNTEQVITNICQLSNPQVIVWYMGCYGLRKAGVQFYKDFLISPILNQNRPATFWLVDLTGWNAFKNLHGSIHRSNSCCDIIESFSDSRIKCIRSAGIFKKMQHLRE